MDVKKDISYLGKDFNQFRKNLINFTKQYFPTQYTDFNESSPGMLFLEMASYVGDVLSYYSDNNLKESLLEQASERKNIYDLTKALGYNAKNTIPGHVNLDVFQLIPATGTGSAVRPNWDYALTVKSGMRVKQKTGDIEFRTTDLVDFTFSSSLDPTEVTIFESDDATKLPVYYLLKKQVPARSGKIETSTFTFTNPVAYDKVVLSPSNTMEIISVTDSDGDTWSEVPYLAQDTMFDEVPNLLENDPELASYRDSSPYLLKLRKTSKRFISRIRSDNRFELQFGAGVSDSNDEEVIPNPTNVGNGLAGFRKPIDVNIDPSNFLYTRAYGQAPANTTLTVVYTTGKGVAENVPANELTKIASVQYNDDPNSNISRDLSNFTKNSLAVNNPEPAAGAKSKDTLQDIKNNALANFATQNRLVTKDDYIIRSYSMPAKFGSVSKAYIVPDDQIMQQDLIETRVPNPLAMNLYVLGFNNVKQLTPVNDAIKTNLKNYLDYYRILTDAVNIKDAFIINIGIDFEITVRSNYNSNEVLLSCIDAVRSYFNIDKWQINQPIVKADVLNLLGNITGVQSVVGIKFNNLFDRTQNYAENPYDLETATRKGIIYPSLDPSIFEIKFPDKDIKGKTTNY
tara:strand:+ start:1079 stop:2959 length:1881 start_codon:yes stop_codon:yes gene_type:complete